MAASERQRESDNHEVEVGKRAEQQGLDVHYFTMRRGFSIKGILMIFSYIRISNINIVHSHGYKPNIFLGVIPSKLLKAKKISTTHGWAKEFASRKASLYEKLNCYFIRRYCRCVAVSKGVYNDMVKRNIPSSKIVIIYNGIDLNAQQTKKNKSSIREYFNIPKDAFVIGTAGRLVKEKGIDVFIKASADFLKSHANAFFLIAGDGPMKPELKSLTRHLQVEHKFRFLGFVTNMDGLFNAIDVFVLSSYTEGLPIVLLEAMQTGCPTICSKVGGISEVINNNVDGLLFESGNSSQLSSKLLLYRDGELRKEISIRAKRKVYEFFSAEKMVNNYIKFYKSL
ncbi:MAG: hypothetical protein B5M53_08850 [Candidatus Cloacimonas sp. 4484_209]|nr:MAG: hypothetical protein B5M53_08850 [Candidatus Cloacimonas sp. 4484_209]